MPINPLGIGISISLHDQFTRNAMRVRSAMAGLSKQSNQLVDENLRAARNIGLGMAAAGAYALRGTSSWINSAAQFEFQMKHTAIIATKTTEGIGAQSENLMRLREEAMRLGKATMFTSEDVASAQKFMAMAGMSTDKILGNIEAAVNLAGATDTMLGGKGGAADIMTNIMTTFGIAAERSSEVADILAKATVSANTNLFDLGEGIKYAGGTLSSLGVGLKETAALLGVMANRGIQASMAGTALENMYRFVVKATGPYATTRHRNLLASMGLTSADFQDATGNLRNVSEMMQMITDATAKMSTADKYRVFQELFGVRGARAGVALGFLDGLEQYKNILNEISNSGGFAKKAMEDMMDTTKGGIDRLTSAWETFKISFGKAVDFIVVPLLNLTTKIIDVITWVLEIPVIGNIIGGITLALITATTVVGGLLAVVTALTLMYRTSMVSFGSMAASIVHGWNQMTLAAMRYRQAAQMGGFVAMGGIPGYTPRTGAGWRYNAAGRAIRTRTSGFGRRGAPIPTRVMERYNQRFGPGAGFMGRMAGGTSFLGRFGTMLSTALRPLMWVGKIFGRFLPFLGWGLLAFDAMGFLRDAVNKNTKVLNQNSESADELRAGVDRLGELIKNKSDEGLVEGRYNDIMSGALENILRRGGEVSEAEIKEAGTARKAIINRIYIDGKRAMEQEIKNKEENDTLIKLGWTQ